MFFTTRKKLGDILLDAGVITEEELQKAIEVQKKSNERIGKILLKLGFVDEKSMLEVLEFQLGVPLYDLQNMVLSKDVVNMIPISLAERYQVVPVKVVGKKMTLAMVDPTNFFAIDDVGRVSGCDIEPVIARERDITAAINQNYGIRDIVEKAVSKLHKNDKDTIYIDEDKATDDEAPIVSIVNSIFSKAIKERASDIHIEPQGYEIRVRFRVDGKLREVATFPQHMQAAIISRVKIMGEMDISERRVPQDGRIKFVEMDKEVDLRISTLPVFFGEKIVVRILDKSAVLIDINKIGLSQENLNRFNQLYRQAYGMILVTGPTGSGKTTTLYSTLQELNKISENVITVEDPVEYHIDGINQVVVNTQAGLTFASALRSILRQDPDIVMVGEIRDSETADIAIRASMTGHLVLSTLHTNDAVSSIARLVDMGIEPFLIASSLRGIVAQRLVRRICPHCITEHKVMINSPEWTFYNIHKLDKVYKGIGCPACNQTGYMGRLGIHEVLAVSPIIRDAINHKLATDVVAELAYNEGMRTMQQDGVDKIKQKLTTIEDVLRATYIP